MRFEASQQMRMGQQMKLAPRMIQSMEILQMPLTELAERIEQELESNPTLELLEVEPGENDSVATADTPDGEMIVEDSARDDFARLDDFEHDNPDASENEFGSARLDELERFDGHHLPDRSLSRLAGEPDAKSEAMAATPARAASVTDQLLEQWGLVEVSERLRPLGEWIIRFLDDDGYLRTSLEEVADRSPESVRRAHTGEDWTLALQAVQLLLEPAGIGARDARECLLLQLDAAIDTEDPALRGVDTGDIAIARRIAGDHLDDLMGNRLPRIADRTGLSIEDIKRGLDVLRRLSLAPARRLLETSEPPITPDAIVEYDEDSDRYIAYLNDWRIPNLRINREYAMMSRDRSVPKRDRDFIKTNLSNAQWLLEAVEQRRNTLLRVIGVILDEQRDYFDYGPEALKPLPMTQVADQLGVHVATVSRAVADKYVQTPRGIVPLRGFFTGGLQTDSGEDMSYDAVKAALREVIDAEDKTNPLSDEALVKELKARGIEIARRTVAKYRDQLSIPTARLRRQY
ncbi:MAG: RNA polymerase factor sigma-54 [Phycisphaerales bacterium]|nr:RNA polymerase factor sigma-54 [Phycisphaerales bacterium]